MSQRCKTDLIIMTAAVSDHRPETHSKQKQKKPADDAGSGCKPRYSNGIGKTKKERADSRWFCRGDGEPTSQCPKKSEKNLDWIVANGVSEKDRGFQSDFNKISLLSKEQKEMDFEYQEKNSLARKIMEILCP